jgi:hypothetical protein
MNQVMWFSPLATVVLKTDCFVSKLLRTIFLHITRFIHQNITTKIRDATSWHVTSPLDVRDTFYIQKNSIFILLHIGLHRNISPISYSCISKKRFLCLVRSSHFNSHNKSPTVHQSSRDSVYCRNNSAVVLKRHPHSRVDSHCTPAI